LPAGFLEPEVEEWSRLIVLTIKEVLLLASYVVRAEIWGSVEGF